MTASEIPPEVIGSALRTREPAFWLDRFAPDDIVAYMAGRGYETLAAANRTYFCDGGLQQQQKQPAVAAGARTALMWLLVAYMCWEMRTRFLRLMGRVFGSKNA